MMTTQAVTLTTHALEPTAVYSYEDRPVTIDDWLGVQESPETVSAYRRDAKRWIDWCEDAGISLLAANRLHADRWVATWRDDVSDATAARRISACSSLHKYLVSVGSAVGNPFEHVTRPKPDVDHSTTPALTDDEAARLLDAASLPKERPVVKAGTAILLMTGMRVSEMVSRDVAHLGVDRGQRTLMVTRKGKKRQDLAITPELGVIIDEYLDGRTEGPLLVTSSGMRTDRVYWHGCVKRLARVAGIEAAERIGPHALRRTVITSMLDAGVPLRDAQMIAGHVDPRTTERYDRSRQHLTRQAAHLTALSARFLRR